MASDGYCPNCGQYKGYSEKSRKEHTLVTCVTNLKLELEDKNAQIEGLKTERYTWENRYKAMKRDEIAMKVDTYGWGELPVTIEADLEDA